MFGRQLILAIVTGVILLTAVRAQSGRHKPSEPAKTTASDPPAEITKPDEKKTDTAPQIQMLVGIDKHEAFVNAPFNLYDAAIDSCSRRLTESGIVAVTTAGPDFDRASAVKAAKQEKTRYVVALRIGGENDGQLQPMSPDQLYLDYLVLEPETAKVKVSGRVSLVAYRAGVGGVGLPSKTTSVQSEYAMRQAATAVADRILARFDIKVRESSP